MTCNHCARGLSLSNRENTERGRDKNEKEATCRFTEAPQFLSLHPPLIQLHLAWGTEQTKLENFLTAAEELLSHAYTLGLQSRRHETEITTLKDGGG